VGKPKKRKELNQAPEMLLWEAPFEFVTPLSLDECSSRLHEINEGKGVFLVPQKSFLILC
jgi:hypothetical protein